MKGDQVWQVALAGQRHVQEVIRRCESTDDLDLAMAALEKLRRHRASFLNHEPFNNHTCTLLMEVHSFGAFASHAHAPFSADCTGCNYHECFTLRRTLKWR